LDIGNGGADRRLVGNQVFVVAAADAGDAVGDRRVALVDVVSHGTRGGTGALADRDGDALAVGQADYDRTAGDRGAHCCRVDNGAAFRHGRRGGQGDASGVLGIGNGGADRCLVGDQVLVIAAADAGNAVGNCRVALVDIVGDGTRGGTGGLPDWDGDGLPIGQADYDRATGDRRIHRGGVDDGAAFGHRWGRG